MRGATRRREGPWQDFQAILDHKWMLGSLVRVIRSGKIDTLSLHGEGEGKKTHSKLSDSPPYFSPSRPTISGC